MKIFLDDMRDPPNDSFTVVRTAQEAIELLKTNQVTAISLDHDLGTFLTGYDVALFIEKGAYEGTLKKLQMRVHTQNPVGRANICRACQNAYRYWSEKERV